jgi:hypothetical protein
MSETVEGVVTSVTAVPEHHAKRTDIISVDSSNFDKFVDDKMGIKPIDAETVAAKEAEVNQAEVESAKKDEEDPTHDVSELGEEKKKGINERFSKLSAAKRAAEEVAAKATESATKSAERLAQLEEEAKELRALKDKYEPVKTEADPKPHPTQFTDIDEYSKALEDWTKETTKIELAKEAKDNAEKASRDNVTKTWQARQDAFKAETTDYAEVVNGADLQIYSACGDAIMESDAGPEILYHLAKNPELVEKMKGMSIPRALVEVGKLEAKFGGEEKTATKQVKTVEVSKAPEPIKRIKSGSGIELSKVDSNGEFQGTFEEFKRLRQAGKL